MNGDVQRQYQTAVGPQTPCSLNSFALIGLGMPNTLLTKNPTTGMIMVRMETMVVRASIGSKMTTVYARTRVDWVQRWILRYANHLAVFVDVA